MRFLPALAFPLCMAACESFDEPVEGDEKPAPAKEKSEPKAEPREDASDKAPEEGKIPVRKDITQGVHIWDVSPGPYSATVHRLEDSTPKGATFLGGALVVEEVIPEEAEGVLNVAFILRNTTDRPIQAAFHIEFRTPTNDVIHGQKKGFDPFVVEARGTVRVSNSSLVTGATKYILLVNTRGIGGQGAPDPSRGG